MDLCDQVFGMLRDGTVSVGEDGVSASSSAGVCAVRLTASSRDPGTGTRHAAIHVQTAGGARATSVSVCASSADVEVEVIEIEDPASDAEASAARALVTIRGQKAHVTHGSSGSAQKSTRLRSRGAAASEAATEARETTLPPRTSALAVWLPAERNGSWRVHREGVETSAGTHMCVTVECEHARRESSASAGAAGEAATSPRYSLTLDVPWLRHADIADAVDPVYVHLLLPSRAHMPAQVCDSQERATAWLRARALAGDQTNVRVPCDHVITKVYPGACERDLEDHPIVRVDAVHEWLQAHADAPATMFVVVSTVPPPGTSTSTARADNKKRVGAAAWREYGALGLTNQGATCYLNALLQGLFHLPLLRRLVYCAPVEWTDDAGVGESLPEGADDDSDVAAALKECQELQALDAFSLRGRAAPSSTTVAELQHVFAALQRPDNQRSPGAFTVSTAALTSAFGWEKHDAWVQHDLQEMKVQLLDALTAFLKKRAPALAAAFSSLMEGAFAKRIRAPARGFVGAARIEPFTDISVPVEGFSTLKDSLRAAFRTDLTGANQYALELADGSTERVDGIAETTLRILPPVLSLHLLRFTYDMASGTRKKITSRLTFPPVLDLEEFVDAAAIPCQVVAGRPSADPDISEVCQAVHSCSARSPTARYRLTAVLAHRGVAGGGHYVAYIRRPCLLGVDSQKSSTAATDEAFSAPQYASGDLATRALASVLSLERADQPDALSQWYLFDDTNVQRVSEQHVLDATSGGETARTGTEDTAYCMFYVREDALEAVIPADAHGAAVGQDAHVSARNDFPRPVQQRLAVLKLQRCISSFRERKILQLKRMNGRAMIHVSTDAHIACDPCPRAPIEKYASNLAQLEVPMAQLASSFDALRYRTAFRLSVPMVSSLRDLWSAVSDALGLPSGCFRLYLVSRRSNGTIRVRDLLPGGTKGSWLPGAVDALDAIDAHSKLYELPDDITQRVPVTLPINAPRSTLDAARCSRPMPMQPPSKRMVATDPDGAAAQAAQLTLALTPGPVFAYQLAVAASGSHVPSTGPAGTSAHVVEPNSDDPVERRWSTWATADTLASDAPCVERHIFLHLSFVHPRMPLVLPLDDAARTAAVSVTTHDTHSSQAMDVDEIRSMHPYFRFLAPAMSRDARNTAVWQRVLLGLMCSGGETLKPSHKWRNAMPEAMQDLFLQRPSFMLDRFINAGLTADDGAVDEIPMIPIHVFLFDEQTPIRSSESFVACPFVRDGPAGFLGTVCIPIAATRGELRKLLSQWIGAQPLHALTDLDAAYEERQVGRAVVSSTAAVPSPPLRRTRNAATRSALHISMWSLASSALKDVTELQSKHDHILVDGGSYSDVPDLRPGEVLWVQRLPTCKPEESTSARPAETRRKRLGMSRKRADSDDLDLTDSSDDPTTPSARGFFGTPARAREWLRAQVDSVNVSVSLAHASCTLKPGKYGTDALVYAPTYSWIRTSDAPENGSQAPLFWQQLFNFVHSKIFAFLDLALASTTHLPAGAVGTVGVQARAVFDCYMQTIRGDTKRELSTDRLASVSPLLQAPLQVRLKDNANVADVQGLLASALRARVVDTVLLGQDLILRALSMAAPAPVSGGETIKESGPICVGLSDDNSSDDDDDVLHSLMRHREGLLKSRSAAVGAAAGNKRRRSWQDDDKADSAMRKRGRDAGPPSAATSSYMHDLESQVLSPQYRAALLSDVESLIQPRHMLLTKQTGEDAFVPFQPSSDGASLLEQLVDFSDAAPRAIQAAPFGQRWAWEALELRVRILDWDDTPPIMRIPCLFDAVLESRPLSRVHLLLDCGGSLGNAARVISMRALEATRKILRTCTPETETDLDYQSLVCRVVQLGELSNSVRELQPADVHLTALLMPICAVTSGDSVSAAADVLSQCVEAPLGGNDKCAALEAILNRPAAEIYAVSRAVVRTHAVPASWPAFPSENAPPAWRGLTASFLHGAAGTSGASARPASSAQRTPHAGRIRWILIADTSCHAATQAPQPPVQATAPKMRSITSFFKAAPPPASAAKPSPTSTPEVRVPQKRNARFPCGDVSLVPSGATDTLADVLRAHLRICGETAMADDDEVLAALLQESNLVQSAADGAIDRATQVREALREPAWNILPVVADAAANAPVQSKANVSDVIDLVDDDSELDSRSAASTAHPTMRLLPVSKLGNIVMDDSAGQASTPGLQLRDTIQLGSQCAPESDKPRGTAQGRVGVPSVSVPYLALRAAVKITDTADVVSRLLCEALYAGATEPGFSTCATSASKVREDTLAASRARARLDGRDSADPDADVLEGKDMASSTTASGGGNTTKVSSRPSSAIERGISIRKM